MGEITQTDLRYVQEAITAEVRVGFKSVNERLDKMDEKVNNTALDTARHDERLLALEKAAQASPGKGQTIAISGSLSAIIYAIVEGVKAWLGKP